MTVKLSGIGYEHAKRLIEEGNFVDDEREAWSDHHPSTLTENEYIEKMDCLSMENGFWRQTTSTK